MKIVINVSNLYVGGGVQVALSFLHELKNIAEENHYHIFLSGAVESQIDQSSFPEYIHFYPIAHSASSLKTRKQIVSRLDALEKEIAPDVVFTLFGPSYWRPKTVHLMGFASQWIINVTSLAFEQLSFRQKVKKRVEGMYKSHYIQKDADYYVVQTEDTKERFCDALAVEREKVFIVGNTFDENFENEGNRSVELPPKKPNEFRMVIITHYYPHKNLEIIRKVLSYLKSNTLQYTFYLTIDEELYRELFAGYEASVINLKPIKAEACAYVYAQCDALFHPTLLESFSASYPEAMKMQKPILTSDLPFAHATCRDAALYFDPLDPKDIAQKIIALSTNEKLQKKLIAKGNARLKDFETAESRAKKYVEICENICQNSRPKSQRVRVIDKK